MKTEKRKMTLAKFLEFAKSEVEALEANPNPERSALLKSNMEKSTEAKTADEEFEVEVALDEPAPPMDLSEISAKLDKIDAAVSKFEDGMVEKAGYDAMVIKQGIAVDLAVELLTAYQAKIADLSAKLEAGGADLTQDSAWDYLRSWEIESAVSNALTALGKAETPPDEAMTSEVGDALKAAFTAKFDALKAAVEAAKIAADEAAAAAKVETCAQCGAAMAGADVCPECGWKVGDAVKAEKRGDPATFGYDTRFTGKPKKTEGN